ncbi:MAG: AAA family ATPase [Candidatus Levybacteria bacterium]|nr:AAA family ATPase [Candidatus Levybacteria bacterium]
METRSSRRGKNPESGTKITNESAPNKEFWKINFGVLTISGDIGTGKTTLADILAKKYGIPEERNIKIGQELRSATNTIDEEGPIERSDDVNNNFDSMQKTIIENADEKHSYILESRLAGIMAYQERKSSPELPIVSILLTASPDTIFNRIKGRRSGLSKDEIAKKVRERTKSDLDLGKEKYGENIESLFDFKYFDLIIDTDSMSSEQIVALIHGYLLEYGFISKKEDESKASPMEHQIFPNPNV